jgi:hypothetical protein
MNPIGQAPAQEEEEDTDYDVFASVRPGGISVDDNPQDEFDGEDVDEFAQFRPREEEIEAVKAEKRKPKKPPTALESAKDYAKQATKETLIGVGGTWGDLAELAGLGNKGGTPGQKTRWDIESEILDKMNQPGYKPSFSDIYMLSGDDDIAPQNFSLPTTKDLEGVNDFLGGPGEPETDAGRYGKRQGRLYGSGLAFGQVNPLPALVAGSVGQFVEDKGGGPLLQAASEIATLLLTQGRGAGKTLVGSAKKEVQDKINRLRSLGYTEQDITLAINSASKGKKAGVKASKGSSTEQAFENFSEHSNAMVSDILTAEIPGIDRGIANVHQMASDAYGQVARDASQLVIRDSTPFINSATGVVRELRRNLGRNPEAETFINRLHDAVVASTQNPTAENFMNFYKELNKAGNWMNRNQKDRLLTQVKNGIKDTFRSDGPQGRQLATRFEEANAGIRQVYQAEEVHNLIQKSATQDGIDFNKLNKLFDKPENVHLFEDVLGARQTENLHQIANTGKEIKNFDKSWKATSLVTGTPTTLAANLSYLIYSGNWPIIIGMKGTEALGRKLSEKSLTDPRFQNLIIRGLNAIKNESPRSYRASQDAMNKYLEEQGVTKNQLQKD